jgi:hypothetical protein
MPVKTGAFAPCGCVDFAHTPTWGMLTTFVGVLP